MIGKNKLLKILNDNSANFAFGLIGVPMALAAQNIVKVAEMGTSNAYGPLIALLLQFTVFMLISTYALQVTRSGNRFFFSVACMAAFSFVLIYITASLPCTERLVQAMLFLCVVPIVSLCIAHIELLEDDNSTFLLLFFLAGTLIILMLVIVSNRNLSAGSLFLGNPAQSSFQHLWENLQWLSRSIVP
jgi:hypothetical protein